MTDWERNMGELPWRKPTDSLRDRIMDDATQRDESLRRQRRMPIHWAAVLAVAAGVIGFFAGMRSQSKLATPVTRVVADVRVVETYSEHNSFDFSGQDTQILPGEFTAYIETPKERQ